MWTVTDIIVRIYNSIARLLILTALWTVTDIIVRIYNSIAGVLILTEAVDSNGYNSQHLQ